MSQQSEQWMTKQELADHFSVSRQTVERWMSQGLPHVRVSDGPRGGLRFDRARCRDWLVNRGVHRVHS